MQTVATRTPYSTLDVMTEIVSRAVANSPKMRADQIAAMMRRVHETAIDLASQRVDLAGDFSEAEKNEMVRDALSVDPAAMGGLQGSSIVDDSDLWPDVPEAKRQQFLELMREYDLSRDESGYPLPHAPDNKIVHHDSVYDPFTGEKMTMLKQRINKAYGLTRDDVSTMFRSPDFTLTAPAYSSIKRQQAIESGTRVGLGSTAASGKETKKAAAKSTAKKTAKTPAKAKVGKAADATGTAPVTKRPVGRPRKSEAEKAATKAARLAKQSSKTDAKGSVVKGKAKSGTRATTRQREKEVA